MMTRTSVVAQLALCLCLLTVQAPTGATCANAGDSIEGVWMCVKAIDKGKERDTSHLRIRHVFTKTQAFRVFRDLVKECSYKADGKGGEGTIDLLSLDGEDKGETYLGIYAIRGDVLEVCLSTSPKSPRPKGFSVQENSDYVVFFLKREAMDGSASLKRVVRQLRTTKSLKQIGFALAEYVHKSGEHPLSAIRSPKGVALLSWRVALLPYLNEEDLFRQFRLNESWDSTHNRRLLDKMPRAYAAPSEDGEGVTPRSSETFYQAPVGVETVFGADTPVTLRSLLLADGARHTIVIVEAADAVPWTKPEDLQYSANRPLPRLGRPDRDGFHVLTADSEVYFITPDVNEQKLRLAIEWNDGREFDIKELTKR